MTQSTPIMNADFLPDAVQWSEGMLLSPQHFQQNDIHLCGPTDAALLFSEWGFPLEDTQWTLQPGIKLIRSQDHVSRERDRDHTHQGDQADFHFSDLSEPQAKSRQDQRKFGDLSHREASQEASSAPVAHHAHDRHHDQRVANQHKQRQHQRRPELHTRCREVEA